MQVWYINLERRRDRKVSIEENFRASGVPRGCVNRFNGTDRNAFDSPESLVESLVHDGFPEFERVLEYPWQSQYLGYMASYLRALREISQLSENCLLMEDDYHLHESYNRIVSSLSELGNDWKLAMLGYNRASKDFLELPRLPDSDTWNMGVPANGNSANIYTPDGARFVLERCLADLATTPECVIQKLKNEHSGVYSRIPSRIAIKTSPQQGGTDVMTKGWPGRGY